MKTYKMAELLKKDQKALNEDLTKLKGELNKAKLKAISRKNSDDSSSANKLRKQIARIHTALNQPKPISKEKVKE